MSNDSVAPIPLCESSGVRGVPLGDTPAQGDGPDSPPFPCCTSLWQTGHFFRDRPRLGAVEKTRYHRILAFLEYWESHHFSIVRMDLTTAPGGSLGSLGSHFKELLRRISRREGRQVQYWRLTTVEGNGVIHSLVAAPGNESLYIPFKWLVAQWLRIHGAPRVYLKRYRYGDSSRKNVAKYLVQQYMAGQPAGLRLSCSWRETFGFPVEATWRLFRDGAVSEGRKDAIVRWRGLLRGETVSPREGVSLNLDLLRGCRLRLKSKPGWGDLYPPSPSPIVPSGNLVALEGAGVILGGHC